jgi:hypothetical protein
MGRGQVGKYLRKVAVLRDSPIGVEIDHKTS